MSKELVKLPIEIVSIADYIINKMDDEDVFDLSLVLKFLDYNTRMALIRFLCDNTRLWYTALVNGYEEEESPEEKVLSYFNNLTPEGWKFNGNFNDSIYQRRTDIQTICNILGHDIKGLSVHERE